MELYHYYHREFLFQDFFGKSNLKQFSANRISTLRLIGCNSTLPHYQYN